VRNFVKVKINVTRILSPSRETSRRSGVHHTVLPANNTVPVSIS